MKKSELFFGFILLPVDIVMIIASFVVAYYLRIDLEVVPAFSDIGLKEYLKYSLYLMPLWIMLFTGSGLYGIKNSRSFPREFYRIFVTSSVAILFLVVGIFLSRSLFFSRLILVFTWVASILLITIGRFTIHLIQKNLLKYGVGIRNIVLIGDNTTSYKVSEFVTNRPSSGYKLCGVLTTSDSNLSKHGLKIVGSINSLSEIIGKYKIDQVVLTETSISKTKTLEIIQICSDHNVTFKYIPDTLSLMTLNVSSELIGSMPVMELRPIPLDGWGRIMKRILDFCISFFGILAFSPLMLIIVLLEKTTSKGPIIYSHSRIGRDGQKFMCHKFRSMYVDKCDFSEGTKWTTASDEINRVTPLGRILRKTNLDELPQLFNVLMGEMSFVGPRPEQPKLVKKFESEIPEYFKRHRVKAGLTGWAQVNGLKGDTSIKERVRYDIYYIENWSLLFDLKIILKTVKLVIDEVLHGKFEYRSRS